MWSDTESKSDYLNFGEVSQLVVDIVENKRMLPISIGIYGNWGAGKSSLLKLIENQLVSVEEHAKGSPNSDSCIVLRFDAWLYQGYDDARASLLESIANALEKAAEGEKGVLDKIKSFSRRVKWFRAMGLLAEGIAFFNGIPTGGVIARSTASIEGIKDGIQNEEEYTEIKDTSKEIKEKATGLLAPHQAKETPIQQIDLFRKEYEQILSDIGKPLIVVIDNLDRCLPQNAIHTLEAIRLFLFLQHTAFIIAADEDMIRSSVAEHFKNASDRHQRDYLDKLIQIPIRVPSIGVREVRSYLFMLYALEQGLSEKQLEILRTKLEENLQKSWKEEPMSVEEALSFVGKEDNTKLEEDFQRAERIAPVLANSSFINGNPRIVKRLLNVVKMRLKIANRRSMRLDEATITKLVIFERCAGAEATRALYSAINSAKDGKPEFFKALEDNQSAELPSSVPKLWGNNPATKEFILDWARLDPKLHDVDLRAALYLSRETMPVGSYIVGLSEAAKEALIALIEVKSKNSQEAQKVITAFPIPERVSVMEGLISKLRQASGWDRRPKGFVGACLLASHSEDAAKLLNRYINDLNTGSHKMPPWMSKSLENEKWRGN